MSIASQLRRTLARARELRYIDREKCSSSQPRGCEMVKYDEMSVVWRVPVADQTDRFMSARSSCLNREKFVVQVDTELFYQMWLAGSSAWGKRESVDCVLRAGMPADHKYEHSADGFSHGLKNPVPLAEAGAWRHNGKARIGFSNGITRTFWLIVNRAPAFPIEVHSLESAELPHRQISFANVGPSIRSSLDLVVVVHVNSVT